MPFGLRYRGDFEGIATRNGVSYGELVLEDRRRSVFHWEFLDPERLVAGRAAVLDAGSPPGGREVYAFWVNQDVVVPRAAFLGAVRGAADGAQERGPRHDDVLVHPERVDLAPAGRRPRVEHRRPAGDEPLGVEELPVEYAPSPVLEHELAVADAVPRRDALEVAAVPQAERHDLQDGRARG